MTDESVALLNQMLDTRLMELTAALHQIASILEGRAKRYSAQDLFLLRRAGHDFRDEQTCGCEYCTDPAEKHGY